MVPFFRSRDQEQNMQMSKRFAWSGLSGVAAMLASAFIVSGSFAEPAATQPSGADKPGDAPSVEKPDAKNMAPDFTLLNHEGKPVTLSDYRGQYVVLEWFNEQCPFVVKHHVKHDTMKSTFSTYKAKVEPGMVWLAINSGRKWDVQKNAKAHAAWELPYPILSDQTGIVGKAYGATNTPQMVIVGPEGEMLYNGAIDNNRSANQLGDINYVAQAFDEILAGKDISVKRNKPYGCTVKY
jgi:peroxiredoxin